ncbi:hypothetical protein ATO8_21081 [Roseivivax marinus]|uniref:Cyclic di-GMP-binding protein n=1 Tax=Roseivivax marinus TaxID=1379903 RepID=W4HD48_9RHOB|nr:cellulose biosynthesis cyclic di-GMP-binding regulatory protein BcsB [Roseivivax marinus]ETW10659.1 hypothetical protein ATO8_21081 [Roseivivax marinus]
MGHLPRKIPFLLGLISFAVLAGRDELNAQQIQLDSLPDVSEPEQQGPDLRPYPTHFQDRGNPATELTDEDNQSIMLPLRPFGLQDSGELGKFRIQGQYKTSEFNLLIPAAAEGSQFYITSQSAIDVLPDRSAIDVSVNGTPIGTIVPDNFDAPQADVLQIPEGLLRAGRNAVVLNAQHVHRVFCGPDAAFSVWTDIVLAESGVETMRSSLRADPLGFLAAAGAELARNQAVTIRTSGQAFSIADAAPVIARVGDIFGGLPPEIRFERYYTVEDAQSQLARVTALPSGRTSPDLPQFRRGGDGAIVLLANSGNYADTGALLLSALPAPEGPSGPPILTPGEPRSLFDLGAPEILGRGRYVNESVPFNLPRDWLLMASQEAELRLDYEYDSGLPEGALLLVKVNGSTIRLLPLDEPDAAGRDLDTLRIPFAANLLGPGINQLTFEALVPGDPPDEACVPRTAPIFRVDGSSILRVPSSPAMSLADIRRSLQALKPEGIGMSESAQTALPLGTLPQVAAIYATNQTDADATAPSPRASLTVGIPSDISDMAGDVVGGNEGPLQGVLLADVVATEETPDAWENVNAGRWWSILFDLDRLQRVPGAVRDSFLTVWEGPESDLGAWLSGRAAEAMLIQPDMQDTDTLWLILRPNIDPRPVVASLATAHERFEGPNGQISLFTEETGWTNWHSPRRPLTALEPLTFGNARAVIGNYVTVTPGRYILPLFALTFISAFIAIGIVILSRRSRQ